MGGHREEAAIGSICEKKERGLRRNQTCHHLDLSILASSTVRKQVSAMEAIQSVYFVMEALSKLLHEATNESPGILQGCRGNVREAGRDWFKQFQSCVTISPQVSLLLTVLFGR